MKVGVFDSGLGGLSITESMVMALPEVDWTYCCDNLNFPYGLKSDQDVLTCVLDTTTRFITAANLQVLVIACNTASTVALEAVRQRVSIPVIGVVPAIKPAAAASKSKIIGVLATPVTIRRPYLQQLINEFAPEHQVTRVGSSCLVSLAEQKMLGHSPDLAVIKSEVADLIDASRRGMDQLVLGCTHFPLLAPELRKLFPKTVTFVDSGQAIANRLATLLNSLAIEDLSCNQMTKTPKSCHDGWCTGPAMSVTYIGVGGNLNLQTLP